MRRLLPALLLLGPTLASAADIRALIAKSHEENKVCEAAYQRAEAAGGALLGVEEGEAYFADAAKTLKVAEEMKKYPGASKSALVATKLLVAQLEGKGTLEDLSMLFELPSCRTIGYYKLGKALAESSRRYRLDPTGTDAVRAAVLTYVKADLDAPLPLVEILIRVALLERLQDAKLVESTRIAALRDRGDAVKDELRKKSEKWDAVTDLESFRKLAEPDKRALTALWLDEVRRTDKLRADLRKLLAELKR